MLSFIFSEMYFMRFEPFFSFSIFPKLFTSSLKFFKLLPQNLLTESTTFERKFSGATLHTLCSGCFYLLLFKFRERIWSKIMETNADFAAAEHGSRSNQTVDVAGGVSETNIFTDKLRQGPKLGVASLQRLVQRWAAEPATCVHQKLLLCFTGNRVR